MPPTFSELERTRCPLPLYIGAHTKDPVKMIRLVNLVGVEAGKTFQSNLRLLAWVSENRADQMVSQLIINQMALRTSVLAELIPRLASGPAGGCMVHKLTVPGVSM